MTTTKTKLDKLEDAAWAASKPRRFAALDAAWDRAMLTPAQSDAIVAWMESDIYGRALDPEAAEAARRARQRLWDFASDEERPLIGGAFAAWELNPKRPGDTA
jgi:predicted transcriptional regulator